MYPAEHVERAQQLLEDCDLAFAEGRARDSRNAACDAIHEVRNVRGVLAELIRERAEQARDRADAALARDS